MFTVPPLDLPPRIEVDYDPDSEGWSIEVYREDKRFPDGMIGLEYLGRIDVANGWVSVENRQGDATR